MGYFRERTYKAGRTEEKVASWVSDHAIEPRSGRVPGNTSAAKQSRNDSQAIRTLARSLNCNCNSTWLDMNCTLDDDHLEAFEAEPQKALKNFRARLSRAVQKPGGQMPYYEVVSHKDGETGEAKRVHVHYIIYLEGVRFENGLWMLGDQAVKDIWGMGGVWAEFLHDQPDYTLKAVYLYRQADRGGKKAYNPSRNLKKPTVTERPVKNPGPLCAPAGAVVMEVGPQNPTYGTQYIRYALCETKENNGYEDGTLGPVTAA